jgi:guanylate kinase
VSTDGSGLLVVLSGPSGVGKKTVIDRVLAETPGYSRAVTATTRQPRPGEKNGVDYLFLTEEEFTARIEQNEFLEHALVHGRRYGTPRQHVAEILERGDVCFLEVDVQGAASIRGLVEPAMYVFLVPPSLEVLEERLRGRATEDEDSLRTRLATARREMEREQEYDVSVVNDELDRAVREVRNQVERWRGRS